MGYPDWRASDEILDGASQGLAFFAEFIPVYDEAAAMAGGGRNLGISLAQDIQGPYDESRGIDLAMLRADAEQLSAAVESSANHRHNLERYWASLAGWHGTAADAARAHRDRFDGMAVQLLQRAAKAPGAIAGAVAAIQDALLRYTGHIRDLYDQRCGGLTVDEVHDAIAEGDTRALAYLVDEFDAKKTAFDAYTRNVQQEIQAHYDIMLANLRPLTEEAFAELPDPGEFREEPATATQTPGGAAEMPVGAVPEEPGAPVPQAVTISQGGNTIELSTPDDQGRVRLSLADATGQPRTYELDFGRGTSAASATGGTGGTGSAGGAQPQPVPPPSGGATPGSAPAGVGAVPTGPAGRKERARTGSPATPAPRLPATLFPWTTTKPVDRLRPDEDGKVVIKDGKVMITVEADDDADELTITLDDGVGNRTSYRVDYADPANPTLHQAAEPAPHLAAVATAPDVQPAGGAAMPVMGGIGAAGGQGGADQERGGNRWLTQEDVVAEEPGERPRAVRPGGVIGEERTR